jgi:hypothetical protein
MASRNLLEFVDIPIAIAQWGEFQEVGVEN